MSAITDRVTVAIERAMARPNPPTATTQHNRRMRHGARVAFAGRKTIVRVHPCLKAMFGELARDSIARRSEYHALRAIWTESRRASDVVPILTLEHRRIGPDRYDTSNGSCDPATIDASIHDVARVFKWPYESILAAAFCGMVPALWISSQVGFGFSLASIERVYVGQWPVGAPPRARRAPQWRALPLLGDRNFGFWDSPRRVVVPMLELAD